MKQTNKLIFIIILSLIFHTSAYAKNNLLPLDEYLKNEDIKSYATKEYVLLRCSANFKFLAQLVASSGGDFQSLINGTTLMVLAAIQARQITNAERQVNQSKDQIQNTMVEIVNSLTEKYVEDGNNNWLNTGSYFQDTYIDSDRDYCQSVYNDIEAFMLNGD